MQVDEIYSAESRRQTDVNESLADDNTVLSVINRTSLLAVREILTNFALISGLHCNFDKTTLLPIFQPTADEEAWIAEAGFSVSASIRLLGTDITTDYRDITNNFERIYQKMITLVSYWSRFRLSLPGRISIAKTFLVSQVNYLGSVFRPSDQQLNNMQTLLNNFIRKNLRISDKRIYLPPEKGGVGFFNLKTFLGSQRCTWLFRAKKFCIDNWRYDLHALAPNNDPLLIRASDVSENTNPVLHGICVDYENFHNNFCMQERNFYDAQIFENNVFIDPGSGNKINKNFFGLDQYQMQTDRIRMLTYSSCFRHGIFKSMQEFRNDGLTLTLVTWMRLRNTVIHAANPIIGRVNTVHNFVHRWRKGGKQIRRIITAHDVTTYSFRNSDSFLTFSGLTGMIPNENYNLAHWCSSWNVTSLSNELRMFIFNTRYNYLPLNNRLHLAP
jgi:hypothetical protein